MLCKRLHNLHVAATVGGEQRLYNKVAKAKKMKAQTDRGGWHGRIGKTLQRIWFLCLQGWKERDNFAA